MGYPFILSYNGDEFARVNYDGSWSVKWDKAMNVRYDQSNSITLRNRAIVACATILIAAKDNFFVTPWEQSDAWADKWDHKSRAIDIRPDDPEPASVQFNIANSGEPCARVNYDGSWSVKWDQIDVISQVQNQSQDQWRTLALASFCNVLKAARYNFAVTPWKDGPESEEDDED